MSKKKIVITIGDPNGCGPIITLKAIKNIGRRIGFIVVGDKKILETIPEYKEVKKKVQIVDVKTNGIDRIKKGFINKLAGQASLSYLNKALEIIKKERISALVTAPVSKEAIKLVCPNFIGHTEYLANYFNTKKFVMMMVSKILKVVLLTRHIPLRKVPSKITKKAFIDVIELVYIFLKDNFKIKNPKLAISSLNPHAGVNTFLDKEEKTIIKAIAECRRPVYGPYPADTLFIEENIKNYDCIISCFHDQAMIPFKLLSFREGANLTVGLPIIRTSPAHGVAFDAVRAKKPLIYTSMAAAIKLAYRLSYEA
jgi:4-hydroxythreonine-4-phosphate dehydrogenase